jgi:hypothetical protein
MTLSTPFGPARKASPINLVDSGRHTFESIEFEKMTESLDLQRQERRIRLFKTNFMNQMSILRSPYPNRSFLEIALNSLACDVLMIAYYGDKLNSSEIVLCDVCKDFSDLLKNYAFNISRHPSTYLLDVVANELEDLEAQLPF